MTRIIKEMEINVPVEKVFSVEKTLQKLKDLLEKQKVGASELSRFQAQSFPRDI